MKNTFSFPGILATFFYLAFFLLLPFSVSAQTPTGSLSLVTSPLPISLIAEPGSTVSTELKVQNTGTESENLKIDVLKFKAFGESGAPRILDPEPGDDFLKWVTFSEPEFTLAPNEWKTVTATFTIPSTASFGYYYALVFTRANEPTPDPAKSQTAVYGGSATLVLLEAKVPGAKRELSVEEFSTDRRMYEFLPTTFTVKLRNTGNVHIAPHGNIFIEKGNDKNIALLDLNAEQRNVLPDSVRIFETGWKDGFPLYEAKAEDGRILHDNKGNLVMRLTWNFANASKLRFGKYTAHLFLVYDDGTRDVPIEGIVTFWVVPWRLLGAGMFVALFFFIGMKNTLLKIWNRIRSLFLKQKQEEDIA